MRRPVVVLLVVVIGLLLVATGILFQRYQKTSADYVQTKAAEETARSGYAEAIDAIAEIQDSLDAIAIGDSTIGLIGRGPDAEQRLTEPRRREALDRIAVLNTGLQRNKARIRRLEADLRQRGVRVSGLEKLISNLKQTVSEKEALVASFSAQVDSLQGRVAALETDVQMSQDTIRVRDETLEQRRRELATVLYMVGSKTDLTKAGVIESKGGVLGVGKTLKLTGRYDANLFQPLDTDQQRTLQTNAEKVEVLTAQPRTSYELTQVGEHVALNIVDPADFRKVRHLVIMTK